MKSKKRSKVKKSKHLNENCWLVATLEYSPVKRCKVCKFRFYQCPFFQFFIVGLILISFSFIVSFVLIKEISKPLMISVFVSFFVYGYFFNKNTEEMIEYNFSLIKAKESLEEAKKSLESKMKDLERFYKLSIGRELKMVELKKEIKKLTQNTTEKETSSKVKNNTDNFKDIIRHK